MNTWATFVGSFNFSPFTSTAETNSTECTFPVYFFVMFQAVYTSLLDFAIILM